MCVRLPLFPWCNYLFYGWIDVSDLPYQYLTGFQLYGQIHICTVFMYLARVNDLPFPLCFSQSFGLQLVLESVDSVRYLRNGQVLGFASVNCIWASMSWALHKSDRWTECVSIQRKFVEILYTHCPQKCSAVLVHILLFHYFHIMCEFGTYTSRWPVLILSFSYYKNQIWPNLNRRKSSIWQRISICPFS